MDVREGIERKIEIKRREVAELELKVREHLAYIRALEDMIKLMDGEDSGESNVRGMRPDSDVGKSQEALRKVGKPLHISELLKAIGKPDDKRNRISLAGTLAGYVRRNHVFTRPGPNTFGLIGFNGTGETKVANKAEEEPPDDFGMDVGITDDDVPF